MRLIMARPLTIEQDQAASRFVARLPGGEAFLSYRTQEDALELVHTFVPEAFRGRGIAERLCRAAFAYARRQGLKVIPTCSYVAEAYLKRHPEEAPLVR
jgi:predicted GNAT family acetyltransferase